MRKSNLVFLWSVPRSVSTAFEKMVAATGDFKVYGEPFIDLYKRSLHSESEAQKVHTECRELCEALLVESQQCPVFVKDMAYHALPFVDDEFLRSVTNTFLIRSPELSIPSLFYMRPDYEEAHTGFEGQYHLFNKILALQSIPPFVTDAEFLRDSPETVIKAWFDYIGFPFSETFLSWQKGSRDDWHDRESWHVKAINSQGFEPKGKEDKNDLSQFPEKVVQSIADNLEYYVHLQKFSRLGTENPVLPQK